MLSHLLENPLAQQVVAAVQQNSTAVALTAAVLGWTLWLLERGRSARLGRQLATSAER